MFSFIKKTDKSDKERRKKDKTRGQDSGSVASTISSDELLRLDEIRRSLKIRTRRKEKDKLPSGITADYSAEFFANLNVVRHDEAAGTSSEGGGGSGPSPSGSLPPHSHVSLATPEATGNRNHNDYGEKRISYSDSSDTSLYSIGKVNTVNGSGSILSPNKSNDFPASSSTNDFGSGIKPITIKIEHPHTNHIAINSKPMPVLPRPNCTGEAQGNTYWNRIPSLERSSILPLPEIRLAELPASRELQIQRQKTTRGDFGFSLRNALRFDLHSIPSSVAPVKPTIFAEPGTGGESIGLVPGDRLLCVNHQSVESMSREDIIEMIRNSNDRVIVQVQPVAELVELFRRCSSNHLSLRQNQVPQWKQYNYDHAMDSSMDNSIWLVHKNGFSAGTQLLVSTGDDQVQIQLQHNLETLTVRCEDVANANPVYLDLTEDLCRLKHLNESSILHTIRQRYANNLIHTMAGDNLIVVNPMAPLSLYSDKIAAMFHGCKVDDMPPHIYSVAQKAYKKMIDNRRDQSVIFVGRSGSGKTTNFKHALFYLSLAAGSLNGMLSIAKINAITNIMESFGNARTSLNKNATRFTQIFRLEFDQYGVIASSSVQMMLLEKNRVGCHGDEFTTNFPVFVRLLAGADVKLQEELRLSNKLLDENMFVQESTGSADELAKHAVEFSKLLDSFTELGFEKESVQAVWHLVAAIVHLGHAGLAIVENQWQFARPVSAQHAASLLGISMEQLTNSVFSPDSTESQNEKCNDTLDQLVVGIYSVVINAILAIINTRTYSHAHTINSIYLIDSPGFQNPSSTAHETGASLSDLSHNYLQERLQQLFYQDKLIAPQARYTQELVTVNAENVSEKNPSPLITLLDKIPQGGRFRKPTSKVRDEDRSGLFWLLDEESIYKKSSETIFLDRVFSQYGDTEYQTLIQRADDPSEFIVNHLNGTNPVLYSVKHWFKHNRTNASVVNQIVQMTNNGAITRFVSNSFGREASMSSAMVNSDRNTQSMRRMSSIRQSNAGGTNKISTLMQVKFTADNIVETLRRTEMHFVTCLLPKHTAAVSAQNLHTDVETMINVPLLRSQIRGSHLFEAARLHRQGFPESLSHFEFIRKFNLLGSEFESDQKIEQILLNNDIDASSYRIGPSQVLLRCGIINQLEAKRDERLSGRIILLQAVCRGFLERKRLAQRRIQELAVRCIQRNVRTYFSVRNWTWWRLLVRVTPLIKTTEDLLKVRNEEMLVLKQKLEKVEVERNQMKAENTRLNFQLSEIGADLNDEQNASQMTNDRLETETSERIALFEKLEQQEQKMKTLQEYTDKLELDLIAAKSDLNGFYEFSNDEDQDESKNMYKLKYNRAAKDLEFARKRSQTQHDHDLEQLIILKKQLGGKLADAYEEVEEQRQIVQQWKQKMQKTASEMNDLKMLLDEQNARNCILEKRQRKFDSDYQVLQESNRKDNVIKERLMREKDNLVAEKFTLEQQLSDAKQSVDAKEDQIAALRHDIEELSCSEISEEQLAQLKRSKMESERTCKEQEEELDDMAGQIQLLEQSKLRLEINLEKMRKEARKESQQRDEELEEFRASFLKKIKALECQLEAEHEERTMLLREKNELDRRLNAVDQQEQADRIHVDALNAKLKKDLRKSKALLKDALSQLDRAKAEAQKKVLIRQLKNELEDAENDRKIAVKMRQTLELEVTDLQNNLDEANRGRNEAEDRANAYFREKTEFQTQIEESEEELAELMKKYTATVKQLNGEQLKISDYEIKISEMELEANTLRERIAELNAKLESLEQHTDQFDAVQTKRLTYRANELESRLELEQAIRVRSEVQCNRHKEHVEKLQNEMIQLKSKEMHTIETTKQLQKSLRDLKEELKESAHREQDCTKKIQERDKQLERIVFDHTSDKNDLQLALQRIADLQYALQDDDDESSESSTGLDLEESDDHDSFVECENDSIPFKS